jgi:hypothetical protein
MELWLAGLLATVFGLIAGIDYVARIFGRTIFGWRRMEPTHPRAATWLVWAVIGIVLASAYSSSGAHETAWSAWALAVEFSAVAFFAMVYDSGKRGIRPVRQWRHALKDIDPAEWKCIGGSLFAGCLWLVSGDPLPTLIGSYAVDFFAALPTLRQAFYRPVEEPASSWLFTVIGNVFNLMAVSSWSIESVESFAVWSYPVYMLTMNGLIFLFVTRQYALSRA